MFMDDEASPYIIGAGWNPINALEENAQNLLGVRLQNIGFRQQDENQHRRFTDSALGLVNAYASRTPAAVKLSKAQDYAASVRARYKRMQVVRLSEHDEPTMPAWLENGR